MNRNIFYKRVIDYAEIEENLVHIFYDSIITDTNFIIIDVSQNVLGLLSYKKEELVGKHLKNILADNATDLISLLINGYFSHTEFKLKDSSGKSIEMFISGYYMGLISDINGKIVILIKNKRSILHEKKKLEKRFYNLNELVYRTSHDIGGPLATIKGLALLAQNTDDPQETQKFLKHIYLHAEKLDLLLEYIREVINKRNWSQEIVEIEDLKNILFQRLERQAKVHQYGISFISENQKEGLFVKSNSLIISILIENILLVLKSYVQVENVNFKLIASWNSIKLSIIDHEIGEFWSKISFMQDSIPANCSTSNYNYIKLKVIRRCMELTKVKIKSVPSQLVITIPVEGFIEF